MQLFLNFSHYIFALRSWAYRLKELWEIINGIFKFCHFINVILKFFLLSMVPLYNCTIKCVTIVTFFNFFRPKSFKTVNLLLYFELKNKRKRKKVNDFGQFWTEKV